MDAIWIPIQPVWGVERNPGGPKANNSIVIIFIFIIVKCLS